MSKRKMIQGHSKNGLPYNCFGKGSRVAVIFQGLLFENKPLTGLPAFFMTRIYTFLNKEYRTCIVTRRPDLPEGCSMRDMSDDYAEMIREEFDVPVDVIGVSTGGSIARHFAADHPDLLRRLVLHSSAHTLNEKAKGAQMRTILKTACPRLPCRHSSYSTRNCPIIPESSCSRK